MFKPVNIKLQFGDLNDEGAYINQILHVKDSIRMKPVFWYKTKLALYSRCKSRSLVMNEAIEFTVGFSHGVEWGWPIGVYLLLAGISGGALILL